MAKRADEGAVVDEPASVSTSFDAVTSPLRRGGADGVPHPLLIEASAGSGKTWTLAHLSARFMVEDEVEPHEILLLTFTRDAARQLRSRVRDRVDDIIGVLESGEGDAPWLDPFRERWSNGASREQDVDRARSVRERLDDLDARTFHSFAAQRLGSSRGGLGDPDPYLRRAVREVVAQWARDDRGESSTILDEWERDAPQRLDTIYHLARSLYDAGWGRHAHTDVVTMVEPDTRGTAVDRDAYHQSRLAQLTVERARELARRDGVVSYSDVLTMLLDRVSSEAGAGLLHELRSTYRVVLIDEFQDTDPIQWRIMERVFRDAPRTRLIMVGDPKQAIYGFRSGGVDTYLAVRHSVGSRGAVTFLENNYRSTPAVVAGINDFFRGAHLHYEVDGIDSATQYHEVSAIRPDVEEPSPIDPVSGRRVVVRIANGPDADVLDDVVGVLGQILATSPASLRDIAILCRRNEDCRVVLRRLRKAGIAAVSESSHSVLETEAAFQVAQLVAALDAPHDVGLANVLRLSWFRDIDEGDVSGALARLRVEGERRGARALARFLRRRDVVRVVANTRDPERHLTDLSHVAELIAREAGGVRSWRRLDEWLHDSSRRGDSAVDESARRLESDRDAVRVLTVHRSKGLEFPYVLAPFLSYTPPREMHTGSRAVSRWTDAGTTVVDGGSGIPWGEDAGELRTLRKKAQMAGEQRRLLYVAMTRAAEGFVGWYQPTKNTPIANEAARLLFDRDPGEMGVWTVRARKYREIQEVTGAKATRRREPEKQVAYPEDVRGYVDWVDASSGDPLRIAQLAFARSAVRVDEVSGGEMNNVSIPSVPPPAWEQRLAPRRVSAWRRWSYSNVAYRLTESGHGALEDGPGFDETRDVGSGVSPSVAGVFGSLRGRELGVAVHRALELLLSGQCESSGDAVSQAFEEALSGFVDGETVAMVATSLDRIRARTVAPWMDQSLAEFGPDSAIAEMRFTLGLGHHRDDRLRILGERMGSLGEGGDFGDYFRTSVVSALDEGWMVGSLDAVLRTSDGRFRIVDYKTDQIPGSPRPYRRESLRRHMIEHHYPWQALFYSVALHRFLSERVADYDPARDLGGVDYYFVRVVGDPTADHDDGVFTWNPPAAAVVAAHEILGAT